MNKLFRQPDWFDQYEEFPVQLLHRNRWFITLRFYAIALLTLTLLFVRFGLGATLSSAQWDVLFGIPVFILSYNIAFSSYFKIVTRKHDYHQLQLFSFLQIVMDLAALSILVYFSGGVESPFLMLYVFHTVIAGLILPVTLVSALSAAIIIFINVFVWMEYYTLIPHQSLGRLYLHPLYQMPPFVLAMSSAFTLVISASAFLAYKIAAEMRTMQESLYALFKKLEQAENDKQKYVMAVVHEIKQPVSAVISLLRIIDQKILGELPAPAEDKVKRAIQRCSEAIDTINNVLKFSRMKLLNELNIEEIDPAHLIEDIFAQYSEQIAEKKLSTETVVKTEILRIKGDSFLLRLAISNLIGNAIKYNIESGKILCAISMKDDEIHLSIEDSGIGIPQGELENVNQQFFRSKQIIGTIEGSGVGLAAVRKIIDLHKGTLAISSPSKLGTDQHPGTIITVILPVA